MNYREAFKKMMRETGIKAVSLACTCGVQERQISTFVNDKKDLNAATLFKLLDAAEQLHPGAKALYFSLLTPVPSGVNPHQLVQEMDSAQLPQLLNAIADRFSQEARKQDPTATAPISA